MHIFITTYPISFTTFCSIIEKKHFDYKTRPNIYCLIFVYHKRLPQSRFDCKLYRHIYVPLSVGFMNVQIKT